MRKFIVYRSIKGYKYELAGPAETESGIIGLDLETEYLKLQNDGLFLARKGYCWDGPSGPSVDTKTFMRGSLFHDAGYQLIRMGLLPIDYKSQIDDLLKRICLEDGMSGFRAWYVHQSVSLFGGGSCLPNTQRHRLPEVAP
ncbi:hypothetical protein [Sedimenticola selenatireducens]|uniref:DUF1353 domain-containing protein n=1 Tax=Sedimenticola selenatireducens TaxID=191960 RepID=A0A558E0W5_9GAMM|nr:hypothetical protein [Sedimenticola selenatireducens]TVO75149.1 hypothetical protein FHP88_09045 [Sedimenticola selenatireducens]TVT66996.1 MAG: hypothetical protein FHK78_01310 [Sedimenticola selenatireducens]